MGRRGKRKQDIESQEAELEDQRSFVRIQYQPSRPPKKQKSDGEQVVSTTSLSCKTKQIITNVTISASAHSIGEEQKRNNKIDRNSTKKEKKNNQFTSNHTKPTNEQVLLDKQFQKSKPKSKEKKTNISTQSGSRKDTTPNKSNIANNKNITLQRRTLSKGVTIEDVQIGTGLPLKDRKKVTVSYIGKLHNNPKVIFDKSTHFSFRLGKGEVIYGWDVGIQGMRIGGKRIIICPPEAAYGNRRVAKIPPGSTLRFEVDALSASM